MDSGPFRAPQPVERRVPGRSESAQRQSEEPQLVKEEPKASYRSTPPEQPEKKPGLVKKVLLPIIILLVVIVIGFFGWMMLSKSQGIAIDTSKYQAVFFTNGQVYFGKLQSVNGQYMKLTDIFYLQAQSTTDPATDSNNPQETSTDQNNVQLIKLGNEVHGPEDEMVISKDQVLFYENLKVDGKVAQSIEKYKKP